MQKSSWWAKADRQEWGPFDAAGLRDLFVAGIIPSYALIRKGTDGKWVPAEKVKGLVSTVAVILHSSPVQLESSAKQLSQPPTARFADEEAIKKAALPQVATLADSQREGSPDSWASASGLEQIRCSAYFRGKECGLWIWHEIIVTAKATWAETNRLVGYVLLLWRKRMLSAACSASNLELGRRLYTTEQGDAQLRAQLSTLNRPGVPQSQRDGLLRILAGLAMQRNEPPIKAEAQWQRAQAARTAVEEHNRRMTEVWIALRPAGLVNWVRVSIGYVVVAFLAVLVLGLMFPSHRTFPSRTVDHTALLSKEKQKAIDDKAVKDNANRTLPDRSENHAASKSNGTDKAAEDTTSKLSETVPSRSESIPTSHNSQQKKSFGTGDDLAKSKKDYAKWLGAELSKGMKEDEFLQKFPGARKSRFSSKPEKGVAVYTIQGDERSSESSTWFFCSNGLIGVTRRWKPDQDSYVKRHKEVMDGLGTPECDKVDKTDVNIWAHTPHNYSWKISEADLIIQYEVSTFTGLAQSITVCSIAGVGGDIDILGFHGNFVEHYKSLSASRPIDPVQGGSRQSNYDNDLKFWLTDPVYGKANEQIAKIIGSGISAKELTLKLGKLAILAKKANLSQIKVQDMFDDALKNAKSKGLEPVFALNAVLESIVFRLAYEELYGKNSDDQSKEQVEYAKKISHSVSEDISRSEFLKKYPKAELTNHSIKDDFREYLIVHVPSKHFYSFIGDRIIAHRQWVLLGDRDKYMKELEERLGKPDTSDLTKEEQVDGVLRRYRWLIKEANVIIVGSVIVKGNNTPTFCLDVLSFKNQVLVNQDKP